jgi:hypothetical protein
MRIYKQLRQHVLEVLIIYSVYFIRHKMFKNDVKSMVAITVNSWYKMEK